MVKLWEKSSIAKVALKRGVQLTTSERMAEDIKVSKESVSCQICTIWVAYVNICILVRNVN